MYEGTTTTTGISHTSLGLWKAKECQKVNERVVMARHRYQNHLIAWTQTRGVRGAVSDCGASRSLRQAALIRTE